MTTIDAERRAKVPIGKMDDVRALGAAIRQKRESIGMLQAELAALSGVGVRFLSELENGKESAHVGRVLRVLRRLGLDLWLRPRSDASRAETHR
jgi:HTH-type transcriptional regulator/antitoxin HipB